MAGGWDDRRYDIGPDVVILHGRSPAGETAAADVRAVRSAFAPPKAPFLQDAEKRPAATVSAGIGQFVDNRYTIEYIRRHAVQKSLSAESAGSRWRTGGSDKAEGRTG
jgi:hypothetical protein